MIDLSMTEDKPDAANPTNCAPTFYDLIDEEDSDESDLEVW